MLTPSQDGCYYPLQNGVSGDAANYPVAAALAGTSTLTGISSTATFFAGQAVLIRAGKANILSILGSDSGWSTSHPAVTFSQDATTHTKGSASARFDVASSFVMGGEIGRFDFPVSQDWSSYDEIRFDARCANLSNFGTIVPGGLVVLLRDSNGNTVSRLGAGLYLSPSSSFLRVLAPLNQLTPLLDVKSLSLCVDSLRDAANKTYSLAVLDQNGPIPSTGVGFTLWLDNFCLTADLHTTVASVPSTTSLVLATPLGASLPDTNLGSTPILYHDDSPALNAFLAQVPDFSEIVFPTGCKIPCASTVLLQGRQGLKFVGRGGAGSSFSNKSFGVPYFLWMGRTGQDFFLINRSRGLCFQGLAWFCNGPMPPVSALNLDQLGTTSGITTDCRFDRCYVQGPLGYELFCGVSISRISRSNCEFIRFRDVWVNTSSSYPGKGIGFYIGGSFNAKSILFDTCSTGNGAVGWRSDGGTFYSRNCSADYNGLDFLVYNAAEPIVIDAFNGEYSGGAAFLNCPYGAIISSSRWSGLLAGGGSPGSQAGAFKFGTANGCYQLLGNKVAPQSSIVVSPVLIDPSSAYGQVLSRGNNYGSNNYGYPSSSSNFWLLAGGAVSEADQWASGSLQGEVLYKRRVFAADDSHALKQLIGRSRSGRLSRASLNQVSLDENGDGTLVGGWLEVRGGLHLKRTLVTVDTDFTQGNTIKDQTAGIILVDASAGPITLLISNPSEYRSQFNQSASALWQFRRIDTTTNVVRIAPYSRGLLVEGMDSNGWIYLSPGATLKLVSDGQQNAKYWRL